MSESPTHTRRIMDVVLAVGPIPTKAGAPVSWEKHFDRNVHIIDDLWIGPLRRIKNGVMDGAEPRGQNYRPGFRQYGSLYGFFRKNAPTGGGSYRNWDADGKLWHCVQMARIIRPHSIGGEYAARVVWEKGRRRQVIPARFSGMGSAAYVGREDENWIRDADVVELRDLLTAFRPDQLPDRVKRAMFYHEIAHQIRYIEIRWPLVVTALEALIHTDDRRLPKKRSMGSTKQFTTRLNSLNAYIPALAWTESDLTRIYDYRSASAHGAGLGSEALNPRVMKLYHVVEDGLRAIIIACIKQPAVAAIFASNTSVRSKL